MSINYIVTRPCTQSTRQKNFLSLVESDGNFEEIISWTRNELGIPPLGFVFKKDVNGKLKVGEKKNIKPINDLFNSKKALQILLTVSHTIQMIYDIPIHWNTSIINVIAFNMVILPIKEISIQRKNDGVFKKEKSLEIKVYANITTKQLIEEIKLYENEIKDILSSSPNTPTYNTKYSKIKNIQIKTDIIKLTDNGISYNKIAEVIEGKYPDMDISFNLNPQSISIYRKRLKKDLENIKESTLYSEIFQIHMRNEVQQIKNST